MGREAATDGMDGREEEEAAAAAGRGEEWRRSIPAGTEVTTVMKPAGSYLSMLQQNAGRASWVGNKILLADLRCLACTRT